MSNIFSVLIFYFLLWLKNAKGGPECISEVEVDVTRDNRSFLTSLINAEMIGLRKWCLMSDGSKELNISVNSVAIHYPIKSSYQFINPEIEMKCHTSKLTCAIQKCKRCFPIYVTTYSVLSLFHKLENVPKLCCYGNLNLSPHNYYTLHYISQPRYVFEVLLTFKRLQALNNVTVFLEENEFQKIDFGGISLQLKMSKKTGHSFDSTIIKDDKGQFYKFPVSLSNGRNEWDPEKVGWMRLDQSGNPIHADLDHLASKFRVTKINQQNRTIQSKFLGMSHKTFKHSLTRMPGVFMQGLQALIQQNIKPPVGQTFQIFLKSSLPSEWKMRNSQSTPISIISGIVYSKVYCSRFHSPVIVFQGKGLKSFQAWIEFAKQR